MVNSTSLPNCLPASDCEFTFRRESPSGLARAMKLFAVHQPTGDVGRLQQRALGRKMGGQIPRDRNKDVSTLVAVPPFAKLLHTRLEDLVGVKSRILSKQCMP